MASKNSNPIYKYQDDKTTETNTISIIPRVINLIYINSARRRNNVVYIQ